MRYFQSNHKVDIFHLVVSGDKEQYESIATLRSLKVSILPAGGNILAAFGGEAVFSLYQMLVYDEVDIKNGDKVVEGSNTYYVRGIPQVIDLPTQYHQEVLIEKVVGT